MRKGHPYRLIGIAVTAMVLSFVLTWIGGCSDPTGPRREQKSEYYVYAIGYRPIPGDNHRVLFKIDATTDSVTDSIRLVYPCLSLICSPDGKYLWSSYSDQTIIYDTKNLSVAHSFNGLGLFEPVYDTSLGYIVAQGGRGVYWLDMETFAVTHIDSAVSLLLTPQMWRLPHLPEKKCILGNFYRRGDSVDFLNDNRMYYYNYQTRTLADSIDLYDISGAPAPPYGELSPGHEMLFGWKTYVGPVYASIAFDLSTGLALQQWWSASIGRIIFVDDGRKFVRTAPGNMQLAPPEEVLPLYDVASLRLVDTLSLRQQGWNGNNLVANDGVWVPGRKRLFAAMGGWTDAGGIAVIALQPYVIEKLLISGNIQFNQITLGKK